MAVGCWLVVVVQVANAMRIVAIGQNFPADAISSSCDGYCFVRAVTLSECSMQTRKAQFEHRDGQQEQIGEFSLLGLNLDCVPSSPSLTRPSTN